MKPTVISNIAPVADSRPGWAMRARQEPHQQEAVCSFFAILMSLLPENPRISGQSAEDLSEAALSTSKCCLSGVSHR